MIGSGAHVLLYMVVAELLSAQSGGPFIANHSLKKVGISAPAVVAVTRLVVVSRHQKPQ